MYPAIYYEVPSYDDELYHHGIKGMRWGVRRYQNADGTLTDAGKRRAETIERRAAEKIERHNQAKARAIATGNAKEISKYIGELSTVQLNDAWSRIDKVQKIRSAIPEPTWKKVAKFSVHAIGSVVGGVVGGSMHAVGKAIGKGIERRAEEKAAERKGKLAAMTAHAKEAELKRFGDSDEASDLNFEENKKTYKNINKVLKRASRQAAWDSAKTAAATTGKQAVSDFFEKLAENDKRLSKL